MRHPRPSKLGAPRRAHPTVRFLFRQIAFQQTTLLDVAERSGIDRATISSWRYTRSPNLANIEACLQVLGYELKPVPRKDG